MNILQTIGCLNRESGGTSTAVPCLCETLGILGSTVFLVAQDGSNMTDTNILPDPRYVQTKLIRSFSLDKLRLTYSPSFSTAIHHLCKTQNIQIIHDNGLWLPCNHAVAKAAIRFNIPLIVQPHGMLEPWAISYRAWKKQLAWKLYQRGNLQGSALIVATCQQEAESIRKTGLRQPIAVIPYALDIPRWEQRGNRPEGLRTALFLSRIHPKKGLLNLVAAWAEVQPAGWCVVVAGPDENGHMQEVEDAVQKAGLQNCFQFVGPVAGAAKADIYRKADIFILPTYSENCGIVVAEALSYGVPVITTKGAPWEGLIEHQCGWWVDIGVEPLADVIRSATKKCDGERLEMGERGRRYVEAMFSAPRIAEEMLAVYHWILGHGTKPDSVQEIGHRFSQVGVKK